MPNITEALLQTAQDMRDAVASVLGLRADVQTIKDSATSQTTTIINTFLGRPPVVQIFCDPLNGDDGHDGLTIDTPKRSLDAIIEGMGTSATSVRLMNNALIQKRLDTFARLDIQGVQKSAQAPGFILNRRQVGFLGVATNSPAPLTGSSNSGIYSNGAPFFAAYIDFVLPDTPSGLNTRSHLTGAGGCAMSFTSCGLLVGSTGAASLIGSLQGQTSVFGDFTLGAGAAGHLFEGVAAGANPNALWPFSSNITAA